MPRKSKTAVGVIGLGIIGTRVVAKLREAGYEVWLWNRSPRTEPNFLASPRDVAESATIIQFFVSDGPALLEAIDGMLLSLTPNHILISHSTIFPEEAREAERRLRPVGAKFIDAPFTGSRDAAAQAGLVYYVGGDARVIEEARPVLEVSSKQILVVGEVGDASTIKIATNVMTAAIVQSTAEAMAIVDRAGISLDKFIEALALNPSRSMTSDMKVVNIAAGDFQPRFSLKHLLKDMQLALRLADENKLELPVTASVTASAMAGIHKGWAEDDLSAVAKHYNLPGDHAVALEAAGTMTEPANAPAAEGGEKKGILKSFFGRK